MSAMTTEVRATILVVEDDTLVARDIEQTLKNLGFGVCGTATTGADAVVLAAKHRPDLILMDVRISGPLDGIATAGIIQGQHDVPVIYLTGYSDQSTVSRAKGTLPYGYLLKPFKTIDLHNAVEIALERHNLEVQVRERERLLATTLRSVGEAVLTTDAEGRVRFLNPVAERLTGWSLAKAIGQPVASVMHVIDEDGGDDVPDPVQEVLRDRGIAVIANATLIARDGVRHPIAETAAAVADDSRLYGAVVVLRDMGQQRNMERQLELADRVAALGTLAVGVAREVSGPLTAVVNHLDASLRAMPAHVMDVRDALGSAAAERLGRIQNALHDARVSAERAAQVAADLGSFTVPDERRLRAVDVRRPLDWAIHVTDAEMRSKAVLTVELGAAPQVLAEETKLGQVFANLLMNAAQAIPAGAPEDNQVRVVTRADERGDLMVEIRDTGRGMRPEVLRRIFEPFFTTRTGATGLGLFTCHAIVRSLGGEIAVESEPGHGTTFRVVLPRITTAGRHEADVRPIAPRQESPHVLAIDDDPSVRGALLRTLEGDHDVTAVPSAREALALIGAGQRFQAIFCDLMMPGMSGMDFFSELRARAPDQAARVIFISGGAFNTRAAEFLRGLPNAFVEKPFDSSALRRAIDEVLGESNSST